MTDRRRPDRADAVAAWATGTGVGLIALMLTWLVGRRVAALWWGPPLGATVAFGAALGVGLAVTVVAGWRLLRGLDPGRE